MAVSKDTDLPCLFSREVRKVEWEWNIGRVRLYTELWPMKIDFTFSLSRITAYT